MRAALAFAVALLAAGCAAPPVEAEDNARVTNVIREEVAHDRALEVLNAERAFAAMAQARGQWTAFRAYAAPDALMFVPDATNAQGWLRERADPPRSVDWQPHRVVIACDGTLAATQGAAQWPDGSHGWFVKVWQLQGDGTWKWVADTGGRLTTPLVAPATVPVEIADCPGAVRPDIVAYPAGAAAGLSRDGTLAWDWRDTPAQRGLRVSIWIGTRYAPTILAGPPTP